MDSIRENSKPLIGASRPNTSTRLPKIMPSYIVAFSHHETYDDIATAQQMICNKQSLQGSRTSVSPTTSTKTLTLDNYSTNILVETEENYETKITIDEAGDDKGKLLEVIKHSLNKDCINTSFESASQEGKKHPVTENCINSAFEKLDYVESAEDIVKDNAYELEDPILSNEAILDEDSLQSSPSTIKESFMTNSSQNTIRQVSSSSLKNKSTNLNICDQVLSSTNALPYGKDIVNVSVAVTYKPSPVKNNEEYQPPVADNLISTDTLVFQSLMTTSESGENPDKDIFLQDKQSSCPSDKTLTLQTKYSEFNSNTTNRTYVVGNLSSEFGKMIMNSDETLAPNSGTLMYSENLIPTISAFDSQELNKKYNRTPLLDTVINMGLLPEMNASTSSAIYFNDDCNNVYVTGDSNKLSRNTKHKENNDGKQDNAKTVLKKPIEKHCEYEKHQDVTLPNESALKTAFNDNDKYFSGEFGTYPKNMNELWDRLVSVVDKAVRRLEESLTEKIVTEIRKYFTVIESNVNTLTQGKIFVRNQLDNNVCNKGIVAEPEKKSQSQCLQCSLVGNQTIDNITLKLSKECPKVELPKHSCKSPQKIHEPNILKDYFEVLKPPEEKAFVIDTNKGDTATMSTAVTSELEATNSFRRVKSLLFGPLTFVRENIVIIASVPAFFIGLLCVYGVIVLLIKPW